MASGGQIKLVVGALTITSAGQAIVAADLGVKKVLTFLGTCYDSGGSKPITFFLNDSGAIKYSDFATPTQSVTIPVGVYNNLTFLAV